MWLDEILTTIFYVGLLINNSGLMRSVERGWGRTPGAMHTQTHTCTYTDQLKQKNDRVRFNMRLVSVGSESAVTVWQWHIDCHWHSYHVIPTVTPHSHQRIQILQTVTKLVRHEEYLWHYLYLFNIVKYFSVLLFHGGRYERGARREERELCNAAAEKSEVSGCCQTDKCLNQNPY